MYRLAGNISFSFLGAIFMSKRMLVSKSKLNLIENFECLA